MSSVLRRLDPTICFTHRLLCALCLMAVLYPVSVLAKQKVDAVLLVDTSASMLTTDPSDFRLEAIRLFVNLIGADDRLAIIGFDSSANLFTNFVTVTDSARAGLVDAVSGRTIPQGAYTNLREPIAKALELAEQKRADAAPMIILLTDGKMDVGDPDRDRRLREELQKVFLPRLIKQGIKLYGLAFSRESDVGLLESLTEPSGGFSRTVRDPRDLGMVFSQIFQAIKQPDNLPLRDGRFVVDAGVSELSVVNNTQGGVPMALKMPSGERYVAPSGKAGSGGLIRIAQPQPGNWSIEGKSDGAFVFAETATTLDVAVTSSPAATAEFWLSFNGSRISEPERLNGLTASCVLSGRNLPSPGTQSIPVSATGSGVFRAALPRVETGNYELTVSLRGATFQREKRLVVRLGDRGPSASATPIPVIPVQAESKPPDAVSEELSSGLRQLLWANLLVFGVLGLGLIGKVLLRGRQWVRR